MFNDVSDYKVYNSGNVPVNLSVTSITNSNINVGLVETGSIFNTGKQEVSLKINGSSSISSTSWDFKNPGTEKIEVDPYYTVNNNVTFNIGGNYSGPLIGQLPLLYKINISISKTN